MTANSSLTADTYISPELLCQIERPSGGCWWVPVRVALVP
jgi:hypothetical protein